ncbi:MAG: segregation/condensation protein A, partial [Microthrixaceae bacterium]
AAARTNPRTVGPDERFFDLTPDLLEGVTPQRVHAAFLKAMEPKPQARIDLFHVAPIRASVIDAVADLCHELPRRRRVSFRDLTASLAERLEVVVHFLAVLELFKQGLVDLRQPVTFGDIEIVWQGGDLEGEAALAGVDAYDG